MLFGETMILTSLTGCQSSGSKPSAQTSAPPNFGPPIQDVRIEAKIAEMENEYNAAKNSQPTHQAEAQAEAARKKRDQEKQAKENAAKDQQEKANPAPGQ